MLSKTSEYAIRALVFIQLQQMQHKRPGVIEIAKEIEAPEAFTAKVLQILTRNNLVQSMKGRGGGFFFKENECTLTLFDVIKHTEGDLIFNKCGFGLTQCSDENPCPLHDKYDAIRDGFLQIAKAETICSLSQKIISGKAVLNRLVTLN
jgi:Rrf2 family protein